MLPAILVVYLTQKLGYDNDSATIIYHLFQMVSFLACVFGAIVSDAWLGSFRTILWMSTIYVAGSAIVSIGSISVLPLPERFENNHDCWHIQMYNQSIACFSFQRVNPSRSVFGGCWMWKL